MKGPIRTVLVDDDESYRLFLRRLLRTAAEVEVVGEADEAKAGIEKAVACDAGAVILDVNMPGMCGIEAAQALRQRLPEARIVLHSATTRVVCLCGHAPPPSVNFVPKEAEDTIVVRRIREAVLGSLEVSLEATGSPPVHGDP